MKRYSNKKLKEGILFALPWIIGLGLFAAYPIGASLYYSLTSYDILSPPFYVGFLNYNELFNDEVFYISLYNTFYFVIIGLPLQLFCAFLIALLLNMNIRNMPIYRTIFFLPTLVPGVVNAMLWRWMYDADVGMINSILEKIGINNPPLWLADPTWAKPALIIMSLWGIGGTIVIFIASLKDVPQELYEAAELDGASSFRKTVYITIPMVSPVILFNTIMGIIGSFQYFTEAHIMTGGGPMRATTFYALYLYQNAFNFFKLGYASAQAWILFIIIFILTILALRISKNWVYYSGQ
ncbi:MAG: sugar ABC transporter permease [Dictyoglomi bacterium]|nr:sugar ABC transporter permease [Dictyoglomota bacterium]